MMVEVESLQDRISESQQKLEKAYQQILLLDQNIRDLEVRYDRAVQNKKNSFRYNLRLKLSVATGVKMMYHHFVSLKADEIRKMRTEQEQLESRMEQEQDDVEMTESPPVQGPVTRARGNRQTRNSTNNSSGMSGASGQSSATHTGQGSRSSRRRRNRNRNRHDNNAQSHG